ncbi:MAG: hypothetical protein J1F69_05620 [Clostridiales bacterium]|nr:hypothetical protein [Clostridiales bacterium]
MARFSIYGRGLEMSRQVQVDYQQIAIQCNSVCEVARARLQELDDMIARIEASSSRIATEQVQQLAEAIRQERSLLDRQINNVSKKADADAQMGLVQMDDMEARYAHRNDTIKAAEQLQQTVDALASQRLMEFESLLEMLLKESIEDYQRKLREQSSGVVTVDSRTQTMLEGISDEVLRQFTYLAYLRDNALVGDKLLKAGELLMEQTVNQTYETRYEQERAKIRAELEASRVAPETVAKVTESAQGTAHEKLAAMRRSATVEIVGEKVRQKSLKIIMDAIRQRGFVVDKKNIKIKRDTNEVILVALKASGEKAEFRIFLDGKFIYDFHGYAGQACQKDIEPFMHDLEEVYGIHITKQTEIWSNPDKIATMKYQATNTNKNKK